MKIRSFVSASPMLTLFKQGLEVQKVVKESLGSYDLNLLQSLVLCAVYFEDDNKIGISTIADALGIPRSNVSHIVNHLESKNYLKRIQDGDDHRFWYLSLTPKAKKILPKIVGYFDKAQNDIEKDTSKKDLLMFQERARFIVDAHKSI